MGASQLAQMVKNLPANAGDVGSVPGLEGSPGGGNDNPFQYSRLENSMDRGAWRATQFTGVAKESDTIQRLSMHMRTHTHTLTDVPLNLMVSSPQLYTYFSFLHLVNTLYTLIFLGK